MNKGLQVSLFLLVAFGGGACRTTLKVSDKGPANARYVASDECEVVDYPNAAEVPAGASELGRVEVRQEEGEDDETTLLKLRQKVCERAGNALSDLLWVHGESESVPRILRANAWLVP